METDVLKLYEGEYDLMGTIITIAMKGEDLTATVPGQPTYTLVPFKKHHFNLKDLTGYSLLFTVEGDKAIKASFIQPNGTFTATRK